MSTTHRTQQSSSAASDQTEQEFYSAGKLPKPVYTTVTPAHPSSLASRKKSLEPPLSNFTPPASVTVSHTHWQSISTAEDQEIRTPSSSPDDEARFRQNPAALFPGANHQWRSTESSGWIAPKEASREKAGVLGGVLESNDLASPIKSMPGLDIFPELISPNTPRPAQQIDKAKTDDLSIPSPLRPPPRPHFSLPASAAGDTSDDHYDPLGTSEPGSPIIGPSEIGKIVSDQYRLGKGFGSSDDGDGDGEGGMRQSGLECRTPSEGSIVMIRPFSNRDSEDSENTSRKGSANINMEGGVIRKVQSQSGSLSDLVLKPVRISKEKDDSDPDEPTTARPDDLSPSSNIIDQPPSATVTDLDHLSPLRSSTLIRTTSSSTSSIHQSPLHYLNRENSTRSIAFSERDRGRASTTYSTFSGEGSEYRDSVRIMTAQHEGFGGHGMARMSVFSLSGYAEEEEDPRLDAVGGVSREVVL